MPFATIDDIWSSIMHVRRSVQMVRPGLALLAASAMSACATLPRNGPTGSQISGDAKKRNDIGFKIIDIVPANIDALSTIEMASGALAALSAEGNVDMLGPGDVLSIEIYEVGVSLSRAPAPMARRPPRPALRRSGAEGSWSIATATSLFLMSARSPSQG
jgi:hypothetical protein